MLTGCAVRHRSVHLIHRGTEHTGFLGERINLLFQRLTLLALSLGIVHFAVLNGQPRDDFLQLAVGLLQPALGDSVITDIALELAHIGGKVFQSRVKVLYLGLKGFAFLARFLFLIEPFLCLLEQFQLLRQVNIRPLGGVHLFGLHTDDSSHLLHGGFELVLLGHEVTGTTHGLGIGNRSLTAQLLHLLDGSFVLR